MKRWLVLCLALVFVATLGGVAHVSAATKTEKAPAKSDAKPAETKKDDKAADKKKAPIDVNSASAEELQTISGIGDAYSKKIVENRPYKRKDEIVKKAGVPQATYDKIKDQIVAKQTAAEKTDAKKDDKKK